MAALRWAWLQDCRTPSKLVLVRLADRADKRGRCWPSFESLMRDTGQCRQTVARAITELETAGLIAVERNPGCVSRYWLPIDGAQSPQKTPSDTSATSLRDRPVDDPVTSLRDRPVEGAEDTGNQSTRWTGPVYEVDRTSLRGRHEPKRTLNEPTKKHIGRDGPAPIFCVPTIDEVNSFCRERGNQVDAEEFVAYYTSNGWKVGRGPMQDWRAAVVTWEKRQRARAKGNGSASRTSRVADKLDEIIRDGLPEEQGRVSNSDPFIEGEYTRGNHEER